MGVGEVQGGPGVKIVIPMSGAGQRYEDGGYEEIKPLIPVDGKPMIEHVVDLFPGEEDILFICSQQHLDECDLADELRALRPTAQIVGIEPHKKGPVHTVLEATEEIDDDTPTVVNYCDFFTNWSFEDFKTQMAVRNPDGCVSSYTGFHPHLLNPGLYAGMRVNADGELLEIREKHCFTEDRMQCHHSAGTYYFGRGAYIKTYFPRLQQEGPEINGEHYVSSVFQFMLNDGLRVEAYDLKHFLQWGTPEDLQEYQYWSDYFRARREVTG